MSFVDVLINIGLLPAGKSVTIKFDVTVDNPWQGATNQVSNQGSVTGTNFGPVLTDDPDVIGAANPTVTLIDQPDVTVAVGSNDQGRIYFNGVDIYAFTEARPLMLDADKGRITLKKGVNVIVFKITNEQNSWQGAMRLMDKAGTPLKNVKIRLSP